MKKASHQLLTSRRMQMIEFNMAEHFDYDQPEQVPEWGWIESHASFSYRGNGEDGVWDFIVNTDRFINGHGVSATIPTALLPVFEYSKLYSINYILFHQGT